MLHIARSLRQFNSDQSERPTRNRSAPLYEADRSIVKRGQMLPQHLAQCIRQFRRVSHGKRRIGADDEVGAEPVAKPSCLRFMKPQTRNMLGRVTDFVDDMWLDAIEHPRRTAFADCHTIPRIAMVMSNR